VITGFNTDIEHEGVVYHVQTEDKGLDSPLILSLVYSGGAILASKRSSYKDLIAAGFDEEKLVKRLKNQHRLICAAISAGRIEELKRMGPSRKTERKAASTVRDTQELIQPMIVETSSERPQMPAESSIADLAASKRPQMPAESSIADLAASERPQMPAESSIADLTSSERPQMPAEASFADLLSEEERPPKPQDSSRPEESAYTVYDPRRKSPAGATAESQTGLVLTIMDEREFYAGESFAIRVLLQNRSSKKEKPVSGVTLSLKILGTTFRPLIFSVKTGRDGIGVVAGRIPYFHSGRAAIVIHAVAEGNTAELRRVIYPPA